MAQTTPTALHEPPTPGRETHPRLSVIVPAFNGRLQLPRCLEALRDSQYTDFEVIVVDDCSTDNTREIAERYGARYLRTPRTLGPGGGRNLGVRHATGDIVVFVDADVVIKPETLGLIADDFATQPDLAAMFGSYDEAPAWPDFLSQYKNLMHHYVHQISSERAVTFWAGCGAVRRDVFNEFGGFNTKKYPNPSIEDIELGYRLSQAGRRILLDKRVQVKHLKKWTVRGLWRADVHYRAIPWANLILETRNLPRDLNLTRSAQISAVLVGLFVVMKLALPLSAAGMFTTVLAWLTPPVIGVAMVVIIIALLALNWRVYAWFAKRRGLLFAIGAVALHWVYYFYSGAVFALCWLRHFARAPLGRRKVDLAAPPSAPEAATGSAPGGKP